MIHTHATATPTDRLIRAMAEFVVAEYLTEQAAANSEPERLRPNPVPLPDLSKAA